IFVQMEEHVRGLGGHVRIAANMSATSQFLPEHLASFARKFPRVTINFKEDTSANVTKAVAYNTVDIGIFTLGTQAIDDSQLEILPYRSDELVVVTAKNHPLGSRRLVRFKDTLQYPYISLEIGLVHQLQETASQLGKTVKIAMRVGSYNTLCRMVAADL